MKQKTEAQIPMRPYFIRAMREWMLDNNLTPILKIDASKPNVRVPQQYLDERKLIDLNIHDQAVQGLEMSNEWILFNARFSGAVHQIDIPINAVLQIYARETRQCMTFGASRAQDGEDDASSGDAGRQKSTGKPSLRIAVNIEKGAESAATGATAPKKPGGKPNLRIVC